MKKLIITTMALSLMAAPAFAFGSSGSNTSGQNQINVGNTTGTITNGGNFSATYGSSNVGAVSAITVNTADIHAPTFNAGLGSAPINYTGLGTTAIGANTYYEQSVSARITESAYPRHKPQNYHLTDAMK